MARTNQDRTGTAEAYLALRSLRTVADTGLAVYVAGVPDEDRHVMRLPGGTYRTLLRGEANPWCDGLDTAAGEQRVAALADETVPELLTLADAADRLPIGQHELNRLARAGSLYPVYGHTVRGRGLVRYLFASQVRHEALKRHVAASVEADAQALAPARDAAMSVWLEQRRLLPPLIHESTVDVDVRPVPSPDPLPLDPASGPLPKVCVEALRRAEGLSWLEYRHPAETGDGFVVAVKVRRRRSPAVRVIAQRQLLAWLLGMADHYGQAELFAYRAGLGS